MYCWKCGERIKPDARFCVRCGTPVHDETQQPPASGIADNGNAVMPVVPHTMPDAAYATGSSATAFAATMADRLKQVWNRHPMYVTLPVALVVAAIVIAAGMGYNRSQILTRAMDACQNQVDEETWDLFVAGEYASYRLSDHGRTLTIDGAGSIDGDLLSCVCDNVGMPQSVRSKIGNTRALDGTLTDSWDNITATWSYHPDDGLSIIMEAH